MPAAARYRRNKAAGIVLCTSRERAKTLRAMTVARPSLPLPVGTTLIRTEEGLLKSISPSARGHDTWQTQGRGISTPAQVSCGRRTVLRFWRLMAPARPRRWPLASYLLRRPGWRKRYAAGAVAQDTLRRS